MKSCELCADPADEVVWQDERCRVQCVGDPDYPGYCRVVWNTHVREMTDLSVTDRRHLMAVVFAVEAALRVLTRGAKINLASFGNQVPHLHWHVIPRTAGDRHFPNPIWGSAGTLGGAVTLPVDRDALRRGIVEALAEEQGG
jgi:diadenosine tetraphosphate (Ap4A) HIT family hydrolase